VERRLHGPGTSSFSLVFDGENYDLSLDSAATSSNTTRADLVADIQGVLGGRRCYRVACSTGSASTIWARR
jgi:hypothetical protein